MISGAANIKMSLDKYILDNLSGVSIDFEGVPFDNTQTVSWIQPRILDMKNIFHRQSNSSGTSYAESVNILFQVNCFAKISGVTNAHKHYLLRDTVANNFPIGKNITIKDYSGASTVTICSMKVRTMINDSPMPQREGLLQYVVAWEIDYLRETSKNN